MKQTYLDSVVTSDNLWLLKTVIPYINPRFASLFAIYIKVVELNNTIKLSNRLSPPPLSEAIKDCLDKETLEMFETMMELFSLFKDNPEMAESMFNGMGDFDFPIKDLINNNNST